MPVPLPAPRSSWCVAMLALGLAGCASARSTDDGPDPDGGATRPDAGPTRGRDGGPAVDLPDAFVDPGCPDAGARGDAGLFDRECDPFDAASCGPGLGCYVFGMSSGDPCEPPRFASRCLSEGPGDDGAGCTGALDCRAGHHCFNTGRGNQCLPLCELAGGEPACPRGSVCRPTDLPGFGACF